VVVFTGVALVTALAMGGKRLLSPTN